MSTNFLDTKKKINFILKYKYCDANIKKYVQAFFKTDVDGNYLIKLALNNKIQLFYSLDKFLDNINLISKRIENIDYEYLEELFRYYSTKNCSLDIIEEKFKMTYTISLEQKLISIGEDYITDLINETSPNDKFNIELDDIKINDSFVFELIYQVEDYLKEQGLELIDTIKKIGYKMKNIQIDYRFIVENICIEELLEDDLNSYINETKSEKINFNYSDIEKINTITVDDIFKQDYNI
jgi:hypothetical protein